MTTIIAPRLLMRSRSRVGAIERAEVTFQSGDGHCQAWLYSPGEAQAGSCVVMAHGFSLTRHDGLEQYAERLAAAGVAVLVFDHRYLGDSSGEPRQHFSKREQMRDWRAAVAWARSHAGVDHGRVVVWGFSFSGGHAIETAAADPSVAAVIALCPLVDGLARALATPPSVSARLLPLAFADLMGRHRLVAVTGAPGEFAAMTLPGEADGFRAVVPEGSPWRNEISPGVFATIALHRPIARARRLRAPVWVGLGEGDVSVSRRAVERFAERVATAELHRYPGDHFAPFLGELPDRVAGDQISFLARHGLLAGA